MIINTAASSTLMLIMIVSITAGETEEVFTLNSDLVVICELVLETLWAKVPWKTSKRASTGIGTICMMSTDNKISVHKASTMDKGFPGEGKESLSKNSPTMFLCRVSFACLQLARADIVRLLARWTIFEINPVMERVKTSSLQLHPNLLLCASHAGFECVRLGLSFSRDPRLAISRDAAGLI